MPVRTTPAESPPKDAPSTALIVAGLLDDEPNRPDHPLQRAREILTATAIELTRLRLDPRWRAEIHEQRNPDRIALVWTRLPASDHG